MPSCWIPGRRKPESDVTLRIFCFPHAGGGSSLYARWRSAFGDDVEVCPVVLPGREARMHEPRFHRIADVMDPVMDALAPSMNVPFAIFGHSLGAILAFEVARRATAAGCPLQLLMVSGRRAPHLHVHRTPIHRLDDAAFVAAVERLNGTPEQVLRDELLRRAFLPSLRADFELNETYVPLPGRALRCEIVGFMGASDPEVSESELIAWREVTSGEFRHHVLAGDHFYLQPCPDELLQLVATHLSRATPAARATAR